MVNKPNIVTVILLSLCLLNRLLCLLVSVLKYDQDGFEETINPRTLLSFVYFEMPFWYLNMATVIHLFEW